MSTIITLRKDKAKVIDLMLEALKLLAFDKLSTDQISATTEHIAAMRLDPRPMNTLCQLASDEKGNTVLAITCRFE